MFEKDIREFEKDGTITHLALAESRAEDQPRTYVQDLIKRDSNKLYDLIINKDAAIYICGDAKGMAKGVQDALAEMLVENQKIDLLEANKTLMSWVATKKYLRDLVSCKYSNNGTETNNHQFNSGHNIDQNVFNKNTDIFFCALGRFIYLMFVSECTIH